MASNYNLEYCFTLLKQNDEAVEKEAKAILKKMCDNIIRSPNETKYRKVRISNAIVETKLLPALGAIECLFAAGFIEDDDGFLLPIGSSLDGIKELKKFLINTTSQTVPTTTETKTPPAPPSQPVVQSNSPATTKIQVEENIRPPLSFFDVIVGNFHRVLRYEDPDLHIKVKKLVPIVRLQNSATEKLRKLQREIKANNSINGKNQTGTSEDEFTMEDLLLFEILQWFKAEFFEWVNSPKCTSCSSDSKFHRERTVNHPHISRVEVYKCTSCDEYIEFPRFSDPEPLLVTRKGRCGEWANVFTLICRTYGYDARFIYDKTDHVWTEVWSLSSNKWIHVDPCEAVLDSPLMYEKGWGKKLSYIFAFSKDEVQDVTWRYTRDERSVKQRRNLCSEKNLVSLIVKLNNERLNSSHCSQTRKNYIIKRKLKELVDMLPAPPGKKKPSEEMEDGKDYQGRTSGSLVWRLARGEVSMNSNESHKWLIPKSCQSFTLKYCVLKDSYEITEELKSTTNASTKQGWQTGAEQCCGIFRKVENDWKMVYLARSPDSDSQVGHIRWTFQSEDEQTVVHSIELRALSTTFEKGKISWKIVGSYGNTNTHKSANIPDAGNFETKDFDGVTAFTIMAYLQTETNWQHAQLFRRSLTPDNKHSMVVKINMRKA